MDKPEILKYLRTSQVLLGEIINKFEDIDINTNSEIKVVFNVFDLVDCISKVEIAIYNYLRERSLK